MVALMLDLPSEAYLAEQQNPMDIDGNHRAGIFAQRSLPSTYYRYGTRCTPVCWTQGRFPPELKRLRAAV